MLIIIIIKIIIIAIIMIVITTIIIIMIIIIAIIIMMMMMMIKIIYLNFTSYFYSSYISELHICLMFPYNPYSIKACVPCKTVTCFEDHSHATMVQKCDSWTPLHTAILPHDIF